LGIKNKGNLMRHKKITLILLSTLLFVYSSLSTADWFTSSEIKALITKADAGDAESQFRVGSAYDTGVGAPRSGENAMKYYMLAAVQGYANAQNSVGSVLQAEKRYTEALPWYERAAAQGHGEANTNLGYFYDLGLGVKQDRQKGVELYKIGAEKNSINGMLNLGVSLWQGAGVAHDLVQAYMWLDLARFYTQNSSNMNAKWRIRGALDEVAKEMTAEQINTAKQLSQEWDVAHRPK
jgi:uncharacterized protein